VSRARAVPTSHGSKRDGPVRCAGCHTFITFLTDQWGQLYLECACGVQLNARRPAPAAECDPVAAPPVVAPRSQHRPKPSERMRAIVGAIGRGRRG